MLINHNQFQRLRQRATAQGVMLWRTCQDDDLPVTFFARRGRDVFHLPGIDDVENFLAYLTQRTQI